MADKWHDINAPGVWQKPKQDTPQSGSTQPADAADDAPPVPPKPLVKLSEGKFVPPDEGTEINKKCPVQVNVEYLDDRRNQCRRSPLAFMQIINDAVSNLSHYVDGYEKDGIAQAEMTMYPRLDTKRATVSIIFSRQSIFEGKDHRQRRPDPAHGDKIHNSSKGRLRRKWRTKV